EGEQKLGRLSKSSFGNPWTTPRISSLLKRVSRLPRKPITKLSPTFEWVKSSACGMPSVRCCFLRMRMNRESEALGFCILTACRLPELRFRRLLGVLTDARSYLRKAVTFPPGGCRPSIFQFAQSGLFIVARRAIVSGVGVGLAHLGKVTPT